MKTDIYKYFDSAQTALMEELTKKKSLDDDLRNRLHAAMKEYKANFVADCRRQRRKNEWTVSSCTVDRVKPLNRIC